MSRISMDAKESRTYKLACKVIAGKLTIKEFSILINKSYRQSQRIIKKVQEDDLLGVIHGNRGMTPHNKTSEEVEAYIVDLLTYKYNGFNLTHFLEKASKTEKIKVSKSTLQRIAKKHGLIKNERRANRRTYKTRPRMPQEGMLIQFDGSNHNWFGSVRTDLIAAIDDATGKVLAAEFFHGEKSINSLKVIKEVVDKNGIPEAFYMDQASIYGKIDRDWESQIERAFNQVNIRLILASSPQAKGRVERLFRTLQDRLIAELKLADINTLEEANTFLKRRYLKEYNDQFSVEPKDKEKAYRRNVFGNTNLIFCKKTKRKIGTGNIFSYKSITYEVASSNCYRGRQVNINTHIDGIESFDIMGKRVKVKMIKAQRTYDYNKKAV